MNRYSMRRRNPVVAPSYRPQSCGMGDNIGSPSGGNFYRELYYMGDNFDITASSGAGTVGAYTNRSIRIDSDADFELQKIIFQSTDPSIKIRIRSSSGEYLTPEAIDLQAMAGTQFDSVGPGSAVSWFTPYIFSTPYRFPRASDIILEAADYSGSTNTLRFCMWGAKIFCGTAPWDNAGKYVKGQPVFRSTGRTSIGANSTSVLTLNMDSDADVLLKKISAVRTGGALISIHEAARGRDWGNTPTHIDNVAGSGQFAHKLSAGRMVPASSSMTFNVQDISGSTNVVEIVMEGVKYHAR